MSGTRTSPDVPRALARTAGPLRHAAPRGRLFETLSRTEFTDEDRALIEIRAMFFLATADAEGRPDCSYKGGLPGFVRVLDRRTLAFPKLGTAPI